MPNDYLSNMSHLLNKLPINAVIYRYINNDFTFIDFNKMAEKTEKISKGELIGKHLTDIFPKAKEFGLFDLLVKAYETGLEQELDIGFYEDERVSGWRHNIINRLENGDLIVTYTDKTEQKSLEKEFQIKSKQFEEAQQIAHLGSWTWDINTNKILWSDEVFRIFGEKPQSFIPTYDKFLSYLNKKDKKLLQEAVEKAIKNKTTYNFEHRIMWDKKQISYVHESGNATYDELGNAISMTGTVLDISERKHFEIQEAQRHKKTQEYQDALLNWAQVDYNNLEDALKQATKISAQTLKVERASIWLYKDDESKLECISMYSSKEALYIEGGILEIDKYPSYFHSLTKGDPLVINDTLTHEATIEFTKDYLIPFNIKSMLDYPIMHAGKLVGVFCNEHTKEIREWTEEDLSFSSAISKNVSLAFEIEKRKIAESKVYRLTQLLETSETIVFYWNAEDNWPVEYVSNNIQKFGYSQEQFLSADIQYMDIIHPDDKIKVAQEVTEHTSNHIDRFSQVYRILTADGQIRWIDDRTVIERDRKGIPTNYLGTIIDITEHKAVENKLQSLGLIVDNSINEIYIFDAKSLKFTYINNSAKKNIGYSLEEMKQITPVDIKPEYNKFTFNDFLKPLLENQKEFLILETIYQRKDFSTYNAEIRIQKMSFDGKNQVVVVAQDISERKKALEQIEENEEKFRKISENALMGIFIYQEKYVYANDAFSNMTEYSLPEIYNLHPWDVIAEDFQEQVKQMVERRLNGEKFPKAYSDINILTKSGQVKIVRASTQTIKYKDAYAGVGTLIDITDIVKTKQELKLLAQAIGQMNELVRITDKEGVLTYINEAVVAHSGYKEIELIGKDISIFRSGKHDKLFYQDLWATISSAQVYKNTIINKKKDNNLYYEETTITPILDDEGNISNYVSTSQDITERVVMEEKMKTLATRDSLTGIYNRYRTNEEIDSEIIRIKRNPSLFALLMFDIDHFKLVNDTYGHDVGDYVLQELSKAILNNIRESDKFGRWGGEEFMLILPETNKEEAMKLAEKLRNTIASCIFKDVSKVTVSVGVTTCNAEDTKEELIKRVDNALYKAKEDGRNRIQFY